MKIPFVALDRTFEEDHDIYMQLAEEVWSSGKIYDGEYVRLLEDRVAFRCNRKYGVAVASCTDALYFALLLYNIKEGDEVIVPSYSFVASASSILRVGATPIFADVNPETFMVTSTEIQKLITSKTKAIIAVDLFGDTLPFWALEKLANDHSLVLIEDAAQSFGALREGRPAGSMGEASCISFDPVKNLGSVGTGGMFLTNDWEIGEKCKALRNHGKISKEANHNFLGIKSKMTTLDAALLFDKLNSYTDKNKRRSEIAMKYYDGLSDIDQVTLPPGKQYPLSIWHKFIIRVEKRNLLETHLHLAGVETKDIYSQPLYAEPIFSNHAPATGLPNVEKITKENVALPIYPELRDDEVDYVIQIIRQFYGLND